MPVEQLGTRKPILEDAMAVLEEAAPAPVMNKPKAPPPKMPSPLDEMMQTGPPTSQPPPEPETELRPGPPAAKTEEPAEAVANVEKEKTSTGASHFLLPLTYDTYNQL